MNFHRLLLATTVAIPLLVGVVACSSSSNNGGDDSVDGMADEMTDETAGEMTDEMVADTAPTDDLLIDEATDGEITNDPNNPLFLQFVVGNNRITASVVAPDRDYITVNVPAGSELTAIELSNYVSLDDRSFIGMQAGSVFTETHENPQVGNLLGFTLFGADLIRSDLLAAMGNGVGALGFTPPLPAGDYSFWIQETGGDPANFSMNFLVAPSN